MIQLNPRDPRPIYEQIRDSIRRLILSGAIRTNEKLPSVRELATGLAINPNTIQRAYRELEAEGCIYTVSNKGSFAAPTESFCSAYIEEKLASYDKLAKELMTLGVSAPELAARLTTIRKENPNHDPGKQRDQDL